MTDALKDNIYIKKEEGQTGIVPQPRGKNGRRPASFLTLSALLHAAFLLLLAPLIFIPGDAVTGALEVISVTVLVEDDNTGIEPVSVPEETSTPENIVLETDVPTPNPDAHDDMAEEPGGREDGDPGEVGTELSGVPGDDPALSRYIARVRTRIERRKYYPASSRRMKEEGTVTVSFQLTPTGNLVTLSVDSSSGFPDLDDAALDAVRNASPYPPFPDALKATRLALRVPITFELQ